jgi:hypothetical protein
MIRNDQEKINNILNNLIGMHVKIESIENKVDIEVRKSVLDSMAAIS